MAPKLATALIALIAGALILGCTGYAVSSITYRDRIHPGVQSLDVDLGGLTEPEARERLAARLEDLARNRPSLRVDGREVVLPAEAFGMGDATELAARLSRSAARAGKESPLGPLWPAVWLAAGRPAVIARLEPDVSALRNALAPLAAEVDRPVVEGQLVPDRADPNLRLQPVPGRPGRRLDVERTAADLAAAVSAPRGAGPVEATLVSIPPAADAAALEAAGTRAAALLAQPLTVALGDRSWTLDRPARLIERIEVGAGGSLAARLDAAAFAAWAGPVGLAGARAPQDARLELRGGEVVVVAETAGTAVELDRLRERVAAALISSERRVEVSPQPVAARVTADALAPHRAEAARALAEPLAIARGDRRWTLGSADLAQLVALPKDASDVVRLDEVRLQAWLATAAKESDRAAKNPQLVVRDGAIGMLDGEEGEALDVPATAALLQTALRAAGPARTVTAATRSIAPDVTEGKLETAKAQAERIVGGTLTARYGQRTWAIARDELPGMLMFGESVGGVVPYLSRPKLIERLQSVAQDLNPALERDYETALSAWEKRQSDRAAAEEARLAEAVRALEEGREPPPAERPRDDPKPKRQWVDVPATAAAMWVAATGERPTRVADVKLTTDDPAASPTTGTQVGLQSAPGAKWIDVNLTTQTLIAYEGDWPVFRSLISAGLPRTPTPVGSYKVFTKLVKDDMRGGSVAAGDAYFLPAVPYVMYFLEGGYAIHGTYWHSNFGNPMSRGCVNLTPENAKWLFEWAPLGTTVVVHN